MKIYHVVKLEDYNDRDKFIYLFSEDQDALKNRVGCTVTIANYSGDIATYIEETNGKNGVFYVSSESDLTADFIDLENENGLQVMTVHQDYGDTVAYIIRKTDDSTIYECDLSNIDRPF